MLRWNPESGRQGGRKVDTAGRAANKDQEGVRRRTGGERRKEQKKRGEGRNTRMVERKRGWKGARRGGPAYSPGTARRSHLPAR